MELIRYENAVCPLSSELLSEDEYCFSVLARILEGECRLTVTDHKRLIVCHSSDPYPVWVWLPRNASPDELDTAYRILKTELGLDGRYRFNMSYSTASYVISRAGEDGFKLGITMNMKVYCCSDPKPPRRAPDGGIRAASSEDLELAVSYMELFHADTGIDSSDTDAHRKRAEELISIGHLFFWQDADGESVAMTSYTVSGGKGSIGNVFTRHDRRRRGYAAALVYAVTCRIIDQGLMPVLYTDADYTASNACYESIGYLEQGSLCTVSQADRQVRCSAAP